MKPADILLAVAGAALLALGAVRIEQGRVVNSRDVVLDGGPACPAAPVRILAPDSGPIRGSVIVFHGLGANRIVMQAPGQQFVAAGLRVYLVDGPGHGADTAPFSFAANEQCSRTLLEHLEKSGEISARRTVLFGHSMGGAVAIRLADDFPSAGTIAVAAAPLVAPHRSPPNLLLVAPQFDMGPVQDMERSLAGAAGGERTGPEDFRQLRAFRMLRVARRTHTSALFDRAALRTMVQWALDSVDAAGVRAPEPDLRAFYGGIFGMLGLILMMPAAASVSARLFGFRTPVSDTAAPRRVPALLAWTMAGIAAAAVLVYWIPLRALRMYSADYLASLVLLAGVPLALGFGLTAPPSRGSQHGAGAAAAALAGALLAAFAILAFGGWMQHYLAEAWPCPARWARIPLLALALLPCCLAEEFALGAPGRLLSVLRHRRILLFLSLRAIFWAVMLFALWTGLSDALLAVIFVAYMGLFSIGQRLGADAIRTRTGSPAAAAVFSAILGAWFLAAAFPLA